MSLTASTRVSDSSPPFTLDHTHRNDMSGLIFARMVETTQEETPQPCYMLYRALLLTLSFLD